MIRLLLIIGHLKYERLLLYEMLIYLWDIFEISILDIKTNIKYKKCWLNFILLNYN